MGTQTHTRTLDMRRHTSTTRTSRHAAAENASSSESAFVNFVATLRDEANNNKPTDQLPPRQPCDDRSGKTYPKPREDQTATTSPLVQEDAISSGTSSDGDSHCSSRSASPRSGSTLPCVEEREGRSSGGFVEQVGPRGAECAHRWSEGAQVNRPVQPQQPQQVRGRKRSRDHQS